MASEGKDGEGSGFMQMVLFVFAGVMFAAGVALGFYSEPASASVTLAAGVFCLIFAFLSRFKRFKGLGIEAELWEQKQEEAARLVETLRSLSSVVAEQLVSVSARLGRLETPVTRRELFALVDRLEKVMSDIDVPPDQREKMKTDFYRYTAVDMSWPIREAIDKAIETKVTEQRKVLEGFSSPVTDLQGHNAASERLHPISSQKVDWQRIRWLEPSAVFYEAFEKTIDDADCLSADERAKLRASIADELADLREWVTNHRLRRPEQWFDGDSR